MDQPPPLPSRTKVTPIKNSLIRGVFEEEKKTVGGLLLFFCITRTIISPLFIAIQYFFLFQTLGGVGKVFSRFPAIYPLMGSDLLLTALGVWAGILIWDLRAKGVRLAKIHLVLGVLIPAAMGIGAQMLGMGMLAEQIGAGLVSTVIFNVSWFFYLVTSERVRNLYEIEASNPQGP